MVRYVSRKGSQEDLWASAEALMAFRRGEDSDEAMVGAMIEADHRNDVRIIASWFTKKPGGGGG